MCHLFRSLITEKPTLMSWLFSMNFLFSERTIYAEGCSLKWYQLSVRFHSNGKRVAKRPNADEKALVTEKITSHFVHPI